MVWKPSSKIISHRISEMHIPPTKLELLKAIKICDILNPIPNFYGYANLRKIAGHKSLDIILFGNWVNLVLTAMKTKISDS